MTHRKRDEQQADEAGERVPTVRTALELLHRTNDFLELCVSRTDLALESEDPGELIEALRAIRDGAHSMADRSRDARERLESERRSA